MGKIKLELPKKYEDRNNKFPEHKGKEKISWSQHTSYSDPEYQNDYYVQYFSEINLGGNVFSDFGGYCGTKIEHNALGREYETPLLQSDLEILKTKVDYPDNCVYEDEICVDLGNGVVCEGYIDRTWYKEDGVEIRDYKTLNLDKKEKYQSEDYGQTTLYCHAKEEKGHKILNSEVFGLGRKGLSFEGEGNYRIRLSGETEIIPTPYSKERAKKVLEDLRKTSENISEDYRIFNKYFGKKE